MDVVVQANSSGTQEAERETRKLLAAMRPYLKKIIIKKTMKWEATGNNMVLKP